MKIYYSPNKSEVLKQARDSLSKILQENKDISVLFLVSGGSSFALLENLKINKNLTIGVLDERYSKDEFVNNFSQLMQTSFYKKAVESGCSFIDTRVGKLTREELVNKFQSALQDWKKNNPKGKIVITQGIGPDGHTAGIMPYPENEYFFKKIFKFDDWVVGYDAGEKNEFSERITTTITFLKDIVDVAIVYAVGNNKLKSLQDLEVVRSLAEEPAQVIKEMKEVILFTDQNIKI